MSKYGNKKVVRHGIKFDSIAEANRYDDLLTLQTAEMISDLEHHPIYVLQPSFKRDGKTIRAIKYEGDFRYREDGRVVVEDVKGGKATQTQAFKIKAKILQFKYPDVELRIVS